MIKESTADVVQGFDVSVVICTYNREASLRQVLLDVMAQDLAPREILVVDQSATHESETLELLRDPRINHIVKNVPNLPAARNLGISKATGRIVLFADDDLRLPPHLVRYIQQSFSREEIHGMAPKVLIVDDGCKPEDILLFPQRYIREKSIRRVDSVIGACMAFRRDALIEVGAFDERLGRLNRSASGEDLEICRRFVRHGMNLWLSDICAVFHYGNIPGGCETRVGEFAGRTDHHRHAFVYILLKENDALIRMRWRAALKCLRYFVARRDVIRQHRILNALHLLRNDIRTVQRFYDQDARTFPENARFDPSSGDLETIPKGSRQGSVCMTKTTEANHLK